MHQTNLTISVHNISKKIRHKEIVAPIQFSLNKGKILALCGGNGAGKSTLIRMITGLIKPTTGNVSMLGFDQKKQQKQFYQMFGYMPDDFNFHRTMTAKETIHFYAKLKKIDNMRTREVIETVGLENDWQKKVGTFSKGMKQRLLLAQALLATPPVLILDEPTNGLDPYWINELANILTAAKSAGQTVIFSTHDLHIAEQIADEVIFLNEGKVISSGPIEQYHDVGLHETYQHLFVKQN